MLECTISFSLWWTMVKMAIHTQKCEQKWLETNNRGAGIKIPLVEKNRKINNRWGTIIQDSKVLEIWVQYSINETGCFFASGCIRFGDLWVFKDFVNCRVQTLSHFKRGIMFNYVERRLYFCVDYLDLKLLVNFFYLHESWLIHALSRVKQISFV